MEKHHFWAIVTSVFVFLIGLDSIIFCVRENCALYLGSYMLVWAAALMMMGSVHFVKAHLQ